MKQFGLLLAGMFCALLAAQVLAKDLEAPEGAADLAAARALIKEKKWEEAIVELQKVIKVDDSAESYNLLAFSQRNLGRYEESLTNYEKALNLNPEFIPAHEYIGQLYIKTGKLSKAREHLKILGELCPKGCEAYEELNKAMQEASTY